MFEIWEETDNLGDLGAKGAKKLPKVKIARAPKIARATLPNRRVTVDTSSRMPPPPKPPRRIISIPKKPLLLPTVQQMPIQTQIDMPVSMPSGTSPSQIVAEIVAASPAPIVDMQPSSNPSKFETVTSLINKGLDIYTAQRSGAFDAANAQNQIITQQTAGGGQVTFDAGGGTGEQGAKAIGGGLGKAFDGVVDWVKNNTLLTAGIVGGAFLLFREPPKYGNRR